MAEKLKHRSMMRGGWTALAAGAMVLVGTAAWAADETPKHGGIAVIGTDGSGLTTLNSHATSATPVLMVSDLWADGLFARDGKGKKVPHIATSWDISPDQKTYTFHLRAGLKWSDGKPFSSADVVFTLKDVAKFNTYQTQMLPNMESVEAPDANTVVVTLKAPLAAALEGFDKEVLPLMPKHIYEGTDVLQNPANRNPVGLGPYKLQAFEQGRSLTFVRNPNYWDQPKPYLDGLVVAIITDTQQQINALLQGEIDFVKLPYTQVARVQEAAKATGKVFARQVEVSAPERASLDFNMRKPPFDNQKVRQAVFHAMDRTRIISDAYHGFAFLATNAIPAQFTELSDPSVDYGKLYPHDVAKAGKLLDEAGFPLVNGKRFTVDLTYSASVFNRSTFEPIAQILAAQWKEVGIETTLSGLDDQLWIDKVYKQNNFDVSLVSLTGRTDPTLGVDRSFLCNPNKLPYVNPSGYCNPELDAIAAKANGAAAADRKQFYKTYEEIVARDLNEISMTNVPTFHGFSTRFEALHTQFDVSFNEYPNWAEVWLKNGK